MSYSHYQQNVPGWGTNQFQFGQPPQPSYQPQPNWRGVDYYNAHAINPDLSLYDNAWNRVRQSSLEQGVGMHEAKIWHRRAYGGLGELGQMMPADIGHAAAYEAYRTWIHNSSLHEPLSGDPERQREGLIGLAVAEATRLLQFSNRGMEGYSRGAAADAAAATAAIIFYDRGERDEDGHRSRSRSRSRHHHHDHDHDYGHGRLHGFERPPNGYSLRRQWLRKLLPTKLWGSTKLLGAPPMQIHGQNSPYGSTVGMPMNAPQPYGSLPPMGANSMPMVSSSYGAAPMVIQGHGQHRHRTSSMSYGQYPQMQYPQGQYGSAMMPRQVLTTAQPTTIILGSGHRKHKKSKRSRSIDYPRHSHRH
ncbi:hypothetical protein C8J57DRAFT_584021 [Mycena rebaudengoi]|nr:hypothetical protein C8J57DRAFT_584021 [Mycena rebaudengoi]